MKHTVEVCCSRELHYLVCRKKVLWTISKKIQDFKWLWSDSLQLTFWPIAENNLSSSGLLYFVEVFCVFCTSSLPEKRELQLPLEIY